MGNKNTTITKTNIKQLDELLDGGIARNGLTTVAGKSGTGKTILLLAIAVKSKKDVVFYSPKLSISQIKARIAKLCIALDIDQSDMTYEINDSLWMTVNMGSHVIRVASDATRALSTREAFTASLDALVESGAVGIALVDSPCLIGDGLDRNDDQLMAHMAVVAERCGCPVVSTILIPKTVRTDEIDKWLKNHVRHESAHVILVSGWPRIKGRNAILSISSFTYDDVKDTWNTKESTIKMRHTFGNHSIQYAG